MINVVNSKLFDSDLDAEVEPFSIAADYTDMPLARMYAIHTLAAGVFQRGVIGDIVECGVFRGGSAALLGHAALTRGRNRHLWLFDSFAGIGKPDHEDGPDADELVGEYKGDPGDVGQAMSRVSVGPNMFDIYEGKFIETFPQAEINEIAILHINQPLYTPVKRCLENFYNKVSDGGLILVDDYGQWSGCRKAIDECVKANGGKADITRIDDSGYYFYKNGLSPADQS